MLEIMVSIEDPFVDEFILNRFSDFFERVAADIKSGDTILCGKYELETCEYLKKQFEKAYIFS